MCQDPVILQYSRSNACSQHVSLPRPIFSSFERGCHFHGEDEASIYTKIVLSARSKLIDPLSLVLQVFSEIHVAVEL
jgi:hypothetical protein